MTTQDKTTYWYLFIGESLVLRKEAEGKYTIPTGLEAPFPVDRILEVYNNERENVFTGETLEIPTESDSYELIGLRTSYDVLDEQAFKTAGKAFELNYWDRHSRFCPVCGTATDYSLPVMKLCPGCKHEIYPSISTAILVLIRKEDSILLVRAKNFRGPFHGLVAGFLETGETLEECVVREVREEVGLEIRNISYFGNQPWPFPSGLMVGFIADYAGGEICLQEEELSSAAYYTRKDLPEIPRKLSLARKMIDWWIENPC